MFMSERAVVAWVRVFMSMGDNDPSSASQITSITELSDGVVLENVLAQICPDHADPTQLDLDLRRRKPGVERKPLEKLLVAIVCAYQGALGKDPNGVIISGCTRQRSYAKDFRDGHPYSSDWILWPVKLILGLAVLAPGKEARIDAIMRLPPDFQTPLSILVQSAIVQCGDMPATNAVAPRAWLAEAGAIRAAAKAATDTAADAGERTAIDTHPAVGESTQSGTVGPLLGKAHANATPSSHADLPPPLIYRHPGLTRDACVPMIRCTTKLTNSSADLSCSNLKYKR
jgi:hypothetical protein